jgi:prevent-host-death family protein
MIVSISEVKRNLSKLIDRVSQGEKVVITRNNLPIADLVFHQSAAERQLGLLVGQFTVPEDFLDESEQVNETFYGNGQ